MSADQWMGLAGGVTALVFGVHAVVTRRVAIGDGDDDGEPNFWLYGTRAVLIGLAALVISALFFASAAGLIDFSH